MARWFEARAEMRPVHCRCFTLWHYSFFVHNIATALDGWQVCFVRVIVEL